MIFRNNLLKQIFHSENSDKPISDYPITLSDQDILGWYFVEKYFSYKFICPLKIMNKNYQNKQEKLCDSQRILAFSYW